MADPLATINLRHTNQTEQADPRQVRNTAGGYTFTIAGQARLMRFLTLGTDGGTYYTTERNLTKQNAEVVLGWARTRAADLVTHVVAVSEAGRAPRNNPALFALAAAASLGDAEGRSAALAALPRVARIGTHLFLFARYVEQFRGWGRGLRRAVGQWYLDKPVDAVAYQALKYRQREGWSHRDLLRLAHPVTGESARRGLFDFICGRDADLTGLPVVDAFVRAQAATTAPEWVTLIDANPSLSWEMLPDTALTKPEVWEALIRNGMPQTALMRQLPRLTNLGLLTPMSATLATVTAQLADPGKLAKARVHPVNVLIAARTYASGHGARGAGTWNPAAEVVDALDAAFYAAFGAVQAAGKRTLLALDVSGSMSMNPISGLPITPREATAALALVTAATEPRTHIMGFSDQFIPIPISPRQRLTDAIAAVSGLPFSRTDCSLPMLWAIQNNVPVDTFIVYTDNETYAGRLHPHQAIREYRQRFGIEARMVVVGMTATDFTIADSADPGMLDVAGFDSAVPNLISDFSAGRL
jgi:60 kDa SS-A/Ro ribonucleoprotein